MNHTKEMTNYASYTQVSQQLRIILCTRITGVGKTQADGLQTVTSTSLFDDKFIW